MKSKKRGMSPEEKLKKMIKAAISSKTRLFECENEPDQKIRRVKDLSEAIAVISKPIIMKPGYQLALIMYDIEDNKIRKYIADYLERMGYIRIQKSIFFGNIARKTHLEVYKILKEINEAYNNGDSILLLPVGTDHITNLKLIGKNINFETIVNQPVTLFF